MKFINALNRLSDALIPDKTITVILDVVFSKPSLLVHTVWFVWWFVFGKDVNLLTNIVSLEAIYIGVLIGVQQLHHHKTHMAAIDKSGKPRK